MKSIVVILGALAPLVLGACASTRPPSPVNATSAGVGIRVKTRAPVKIFSNEPDGVVFVKLSEGGGPPYTDGSMLSSNFADDGYFYLLNAPPGRYVAVLCGRIQAAPPTAPPAAPPKGTSVSVSVGIGKTEYTTYFPADMVKLTEVTVTPGAVAFMGDYVVDMSTELADADETQRHFYHLLAPKDESRDFLAKAFSGDYQYKGTLHQRREDTQAREEFSKYAHESLTKAGWSIALQ